MKSKQDISMLVLLILSSFSFLAKADIAPLDAPFFSQRDTRWALDDMDGYNIHDYGCMMTAFDMVLAYYGVNTNPKEFNSYLKSGKGAWS